MADPYIELVNESQQILKECATKAYETEPTPDVRFKRFDDYQEEFRKSLKTAIDENTGRVIDDLFIDFTENDPPYRSFQREQTLETYREMMQLIHEWSVDDFNHNILEINEELRVLRIYPNPDPEVDIREYFHNKLQVWLALQQPLY